MDGSMLPGSKLPAPAVGRFRLPSVRGASAWGTVVRADPRSDPTAAPSRLVGAPGSKRPVPGDGSVVRVVSSRASANDDVTTTLPPHAEHLRIAGLTAQTLALNLLSTVTAA